MARLSKEEIDEIAEALAPKLVEDVRKTHHDFWIDPEKHYLDHQNCLQRDEVTEVKQLVSMWRVTKSLWFKAFIGFALVGALAVTGVGAALSKLGVLFK